MPHVVVNNVAYDFKLEKNDWDLLLIDKLESLDSLEIKKLFRPMYDFAFPKLFRQKVSSLSPARKSKLFKVLPKDIISDFDLS
jgi:hypothetical protein